MRLLLLVATIVVVSVVVVDVDAVVLVAKTFDDVAININDAISDIGDSVVTTRVPQLMRLIRSRATSSYHTSPRSRRSLCNGFQQYIPVASAIDAKP